MLFCYFAYLREIVGTATAKSSQIQIATNGLIPGLWTSIYASSLERSDLNTVCHQFDGLLPLLMKSSVVAMYFLKSSGLGITFARPI